jgi:hypothetical protein
MRVETDVVMIETAAVLPVVLVALALALAHADTHLISRSLVGGTVVVRANTAVVVVVAHVPTMITKETLETTEIGTETATQETVWISETEIEIAGIGTVATDGTVARVPDEADLPIVLA